MEALARLLGIPEKELRRVAPLSGAYGIVLASLYVLKPARNALFLNRLGIDQLPYVLILVALVGGGVATLYSRLGASIRVDRLIVRTFVLMMVVLFGFWILIPLGWSWVYYVFYVWVNLLGLVATSLLWLLGNAAFNAREARRLFGLIGTGGIAGAILGGLFTGWAAPVMGTNNLLLVCIASLAATLLLLRRVQIPESPRPVRKKPTVEDEGSAVHLIRNSALLRQIALMAALAAGVAVVVDIQFNEIVERSFPGEDEKAAFFGTFFAYLSGFAFVFQLLLASRVLRRVGAIVALLFLPLGLALGSTAILITPVLWAGVAAKISDGGFRHSINKSAMEILYLPVPSDLKKKTKLFIDATADTFATGLGALSVLLLTKFFGVSYAQLSLLSLGLIVVWGGVIYRSRRAYVDAFRKAIERRQIDIAEMNVGIAEAGAVKALLDTLSSSNPRQVLYGLDMLAGVRSRALPEQLLGLLDHELPDVREKAVRLLHDNAAVEALEPVRGLLRDTSPAVAAEALYFLGDFGPEPRKDVLRATLAEDDVSLRLAAMICIAQHGTLEERGLITDAIILGVLAIEGAERERARSTLAVALGGLGDDRFGPHLEELRSDPSPSVVRSVISSVGRLRLPELIPWLQSQLSRHEQRQAARRALVEYGSLAVAPLAETLIAPNTPLRIREQIPRILAHIGAQDCVESLFSALSQVPVALRTPIARALAQLHEEFPHLRMGRTRTAQEVIQEARAHRELMRALSAFEDAEGTGPELLARTLREKCGEQRRRIFWFLELTYDAHDMRNAYAGVESVDSRLRASAVEFLDNVLTRELSDRVLPVFDPSAQPSAAPRTPERALTKLLHDPDDWIRACALYVTPQFASPALFSEIEACLADPNRSIREAAQLSINSWPRT